MTGSSLFARARKWRLSVKEVPIGGSQGGQRWEHQFDKRELPSAVLHGDVAVADYNQDGRVDVVLTGTTQQQPPFEGASMLYRNEGDGQFVEVQVPFAGVYGSTAAWGDYDNDGDPDLLLSGEASPNEYVDCSLPK